jgi:hypothetical protein
MAVAIKTFKGVPDGAIYPIEFRPGDVVSGALAVVAVSEGWAEEVPAVSAVKLPPPPPQRRAAKNGF